MNGFYIIDIWHVDAFVILYMSEKRVLRFKLLPIFFDISSTFGNGD